MGRQVPEEGLTGRPNPARSGLAKPVEAHNRTGWGPLVRRPEVEDHPAGTRPGRSWPQHTTRPAPWLRQTQRGRLKAVRETLTAALGTVVGEACPVCGELVGLDDQDDHALRQHSCEGWAYLADWEPDE